MNAQCYCLVIVLSVTVDCKNKLYHGPNVSNLAVLEWTPGG